MTSIAGRYDRSAARYERWWAPVLARTGIELLERAAAALDGDVPRRILDVGTGTGALARAAVVRWPTATIVGLDASRAMLDVARGEAARMLSPKVTARLDWRTGLAESLPFGDADFDLVASAFVYQLVRDRLAALREAHRVLVPGGRLAYVTWLDSGDDFVPQRVVDDLIDEERLDDGVAGEEDRAGDVVSSQAAARELRRAGFVHVAARVATLEYAWTARSYLGFVEHYDAVDLLEPLAVAERRRIRALLAGRLGALAATDFIWRAPVVMAGGVKPDTVEPAG
jgi:ubiquinone/menaquinone biosynthesis C-methylase UbiE